MPRNRKRTTEKASWTQSILENAVRAVRNKGKSIHKVAKETGIPYSTLQKRLKNELFNSGPAMGKKPVFSKTQEEALASHVIKFSNMFYGLNTVQLRRVAFECAEGLQIKHNFCKETRLAGRDWLVGFLRRNPEISLRKPEATKQEEEKFYKNLEELCAKYGFSPSRVCSANECGISAVQEAGPASDQNDSITNREERNDVTVINAVSTWIRKCQVAEFKMIE